MTKEAPITICQSPDAAALAFLQKVFCDRVRHDIKRFGPEKALADWRVICDYMKTYDWWPSVARKVEAVFDEAPDELFHFIHPSLDDDEGWKIHNEVKRLVRRQSVPDIIKYLRNLESENIILLPTVSSVAYDELVRMGMPNTGGFSKEHFRKQYHL